MEETTEETRQRINDLSDQIIKAGFVVSNTLGAGFLEKVYENSLAHLLRKGGLKVEQQHPITVHFDGVVVGKYDADLLVEDLVLVELKAAKSLGDVDLAQCLNYLRATGKKLCLLMNFGPPKMEHRRVVHHL